VSRDEVFEFIYMYIPFEGTVKLLMVLSRTTIIINVNMVKREQSPSHRTIVYKFCKVKVKFRRCLSTKYLSLSYLYTPFKGTVKLLMVLSRTTITISVNMVKRDQPPSHRYSCIVCINQIR